MATLFVLNHRDGLQECLAIAASSDGLLLIEDAVWHAVSDQPRVVHVIKEDMDTREISHHGRNVKPIGYAEFVDLAISHQPIVSWR
jgi:sulfur relay protein TusB/DsrH